MLRWDEMLACHGDSLHSAFQYRSLANEYRDSTEREAIG